MLPVVVAMTALGTVRQRRWEESFIVSVMRLERGGNGSKVHEYRMVEMVSRKDQK